MEHGKGKINILTFKNKKIHALLKKKKNTKLILQEVFRSFSEFYILFITQQTHCKT